LQAEPAKAKNGQMVCDFLYHETGSFYRLMQFHLPDGALRTCTSPNSLIT
jgi:hypothetical protein